MFVVDTHPLLWHLTEDAKLGRRAKEVLDKTDRGEITVIVPTIVLAEALFILEKKRADLKFKDISRKHPSGANPLLATAKQRMVPI
jgi:predicted nucleic acid-binding protein